MMQSSDERSSISQQHAGGDKPLNVASEKERTEYLDSNEHGQESRYPAHRAGHGRPARAVFPFPASPLVPRQRRVLKRAEDNAYRSSDHNRGQRYYRIKHFVVLPIFNFGTPRGEPPPRSGPCITIYDFLGCVVSENLSILKPLYPRTPISGISSPSISSSIGTRFPTIFSAIW